MLHAASATNASTIPSGRSVAATSSAIARAGRRSGVRSSVATPAVAATSAALIATVSSPEVV
jgi:hypothetical protein